jgi:hypothetical protein
LPVTLRCEHSEPRRATARAIHPSRAAARPPQDDGSTNSDLAALPRPSSAKHHGNLCPHDKPRGAERRKAHPTNVRATFRHCRLLVWARTRALTGRARLPALRRGSRHNSHIVAQLQARLAGTRLRRALPAVSRPSSSESTSRIGLRADGHDTQSRPGAGLRIPPAGTALAPSIGRHR